jgi:hypothetical protein
MSHLRFLRISSSRPLFRRLVAVFCAFAFLTVGTLHTFGCCCDEPSAASAAIVSSVTGDGPADSGTFSPVHCHCFNCSGVVLPEFAASAPETVIPSATAAVHQPLLCAHNPGLDTPPPRTAA